MKHSINKNNGKYEISDVQGKVVAKSSSYIKARRSINYRERATEKKVFVQKGMQLREHPVIHSVRNKKVGP